MIRHHVCPNGHPGEIWLPVDAKKTIVKCPFCGVEEDVKHLLAGKTKEELELEEYKRLHEIYKNK